MKSNLHEMQLHELFGTAESYAQTQLRQTGIVAPAYFYAGDDGRSVVVSPGFETSEAKHQFTAMLRVLALARRITAGVLVTHTWLKFYEPDEVIDLHEPIAKAPGREEFVLLAGECRGGGTRKLLPVVRTDNGSFHHFGEPIVAGDIQSWPPDLLPEKEPDATVYEAAKTVWRLLEQQAEGQRSE